MNIFLIGAGYDSEGSHVTDFVTLGTCPYWVPSLKDVDAYLSAKFKCWNNRLSPKLQSFLFNRIKQIKRYAIEPDESVMLDRVIEPGKYLTWTVFSDFETSEDGEQDEVEFVLALQTIDWGIMFFKILSKCLAKICPAHTWFSEQAETVIELAIPADDFDQLKKES